MPHNERAVDRWIRVLLGSVLLILMFRGTVGWWGWVGLVPILTGISGYCPLYHAFGWSTRRREGHAHA